MLYYIEKLRKECKEERDQLAAIVASGNITSLQSYGTHCGAILTLDRVIARIDDARKKLEEEKD